jgi:hypothetical protein
MSSGGGTPPPRDACERHPFWFLVRPPSTHRANGGGPTRLVHYDLYRAECAAECARHPLRLQCALKQTGTEVEELQQCSNRADCLTAVDVMSRVVHHLRACVHVRVCVCACEPAGLKDGSAAAQHSGALFSGAAGSDMTSDDSARGSPITHLVQVLAIKEDMPIEESAEAHRAEALTCELIQCSRCW